MKKLIEEIEDKYGHILQVWGGEKDASIEMYDFDGSVDIELTIDEVRSLVDSLSWWLAMYDIGEESTRDSAR